MMDMLENECWAGFPAKVEKAEKPIMPISDPSPRLGEAMTQQTVGGAVT